MPVLSGRHQRLDHQISGYKGANLYKLKNKYPPKDIFLAVPKRLLKFTSLQTPKFEFHVAKSDIATLDYVKTRLTHQP